MEKQCKTIGVSTNYTETNSAISDVVNTNGIEEVDQEKITNAGNMKQESVLTFSL